jgi:RimJ/RimL family protein N-acetyltransferase
VTETILQTERLILRRLCLDDTAFILRLLNEPSFLQNIGDRKVRTIEDARNYILNNPMASYQRLGFGLYLVEEKATGAAIGMCGLLKRDSLDFPDLGYALVPEFWGRGYAMESAAAVLAYARNTLNLSRILAITNEDNERSIRVLERIGFSFAKTIRMNGDAAEVKLFVFDPPTA